MGCFIMISTDTSVNLGHIPLVNHRQWVQFELLVTIQDNGSMIDSRGSSQEMGL